MSKRCPDCGFINEDSKIYCASCGEPLDANLRLITSLEKQTSAPVKAHEEPKAKPEPEKPAPKRSNDGGDVSGKLAKDTKSSPMPWIILGVVAVVVVVAVILLL